MLCRELLQTDLDNVAEWSKANNMLLHEDKIEVMNYCLNTSLLLRNLPFTAELRQYTTSDGKIIDPVEVIRDLGVYLSNDCSWTTHVNMIAVEARRKASWVLGTFQDRSPLTMITLFKSLVRSKLEYCCPVWDPSKIGDIQTLENVQRQFTRRIAGCKDLDYWGRLKKLGIISLQRRRERYSIIQVWKILHNETQNSTSLTFYTSERLGMKASVPAFNHSAQKSCSSAYDNSFGVKAIRLWNILPKSVNSQKTLDLFKVSLGRFLDKFPDSPPVPGYTPPNSNSLLDWSCSGGYGVCA